MNIILITKKGRSRHHLHLSGTMHYMAVGVSFLLMAFSFTGLGYWLGAKYQSDGYIRAWQSELDEQRLAVADLRDMTEAKVSALTTRIGQMHGHITRLNALGDKLVKMANLDESEFEFDNPPAVGGPGEGAVTENAEDQGALENAITRLGLELGYREYQLFVLEEILRSRNLHEEVHPAGRPVIKGWVSSYYGYRNNPFDGGRELHKGIDIAAKEGTEIVAVAGGVITWSDRRFGYGNMVEINHGNGYSTRYGHCSSLLVKEGEAVKKGQVVALMGSTGRSTGPHVHFEVLKEGTQVNPLDFIYASN
jgi:murein DD-endopeptidase MepM/ murein hydrolase activator NlpD